MTATISQHICYQGRHWNHGALKALREDPFCIVVIPRKSLHQRIHEWVTDIPAPREEFAAEALARIDDLRQRGAISNDNNLELHLMVLIALFDCVEQPTADALRKQLQIVRTVTKPS